MRIRIFSIFLLSLLLSACSDDAGQPDSGSMDADGSQAGDLAGDEGDQERAVRVLFIVDTSQSMGISDSEILRRTEFERAVDLFLADPEVSFGAMVMGNETIMLTDGFTHSTAELGEAAARLSQVGGNSSFRAAFGIAESRLEDDMRASKPVPNERTYYRIFLLSDSLPGLGETEAEIQEDLAAIMSLQTEHGVREIRLHTALLIDSAVHVDPAVLADMVGFFERLAETGLGSFTNYHESQAIDFSVAIPPQS
ncbi:MAG: VWA domain-containing protein [Deltaproteobacteria bacterium]|nr:VWA domain-containing protein [Deltaproteobacteria bacterium]